MIKVCKREECKIEFETKDSRKVYCGRSCAAKVNNTVFPKRKPVYTDRECLECSRKLQRHQKSYCSHACRTKNQTESLIEQWLRGKVPGSGDNGALKNVFRRYLLEQANYRCQSPTCAVPGGWSVPNPVTGKPILTVDHIDGNWKNNAVDNLIVLCYSCHTLTPTFGSLNKKSAGIRGSGNRVYKEYSMNRKAAEQVPLG